ncbi:MAG: HAD family hydrolase [Actinomycetota bacterium]
MTPRVDTVVWDLGAVVIDWDPRYLYRQLLPDDTAVEAFLGEVCTPAWHHRHDEGRPIAEGVAELAEAHPEHATLIRAYLDRWDEMFAGEIEGSVALMDALDAVGVPQYGLTNWPAEMFPRALARFPSLRVLRGVVVSGEEGVAKPSPEVFRRLLDRFGLDVSTCLFVDDSPRNVEAAASLGFAVERFTTPAAFRARLVEEGLLPADADRGAVVSIPATSRRRRRPTKEEGYP